MFLSLDPGIIQFKKRGILVKESCNFANIEVERIDGADGEVTVDWKTEDGSAKSPEDYQGGEGTLIFKHGEVRNTYTNSYIINCFILK